MSFSNRRKSAGADTTAAVAKTKHEFERLALPLIESLFNFAYWLTRNQEEAEDLVQETYMKAWHGFETFRGDSMFRTWIFRILRNAFLSSCKDVHTRRVESLDEERHEAFLPRTKETPESILVEHANLSALREAIEEIPLAMREIIILREVEEMPYQEIGAILGIPIGTVMSRLARARRTLRETALAKLGGPQK
jgi:RNA polymerase sigma-70 factor (ECF subfamily)